MPGASGGGRIAARLARLRLRGKLAIAGVVVLVLVAAIGGGALAYAARRPAGTEQFLSQAPGFVAYVEFVPAGSSLSGTLDVSSLPPGAGVSANYEYAFTGTLSASRIRIDLASVDPAGTSTLEGTVRGGNLVLPLWQADGPVVNRTLVPSTTTAFQNSVARVDELASRNAERALDARAVDAAASGLNRAYRSVVADQSQVAGYDLPFGEDVARAEADYEQTLIDAQSAEQSSRATCAAQAATAVQDQSDVLSDEYVVEGDQESLDAELASARHDLSALRSAGTAYQEALGRDPGHEDMVPTTDQIDAAEQGLTGQITASSQTMQGYVAETAGYAQQAKALAQTASQACG
ncbi:MAG TPA: hypothetical protein VIA06_24565 [Candidatus Dormibacteraeota bacterium]|nr:hypothetical protein [Candidatus Dormibacteraeota bacterium]